MIVLDVETTGLNAWRASLVSLGAVQLEQPSHTFYEECRVPVEADVNDAALEVNGFSRDELYQESKQSEDALVRSFSRWCDQLEDHTFAGLNHHLDLMFIMAAGQTDIGIGQESSGVIPKRIVDLHSVCVCHMARQGYELPVEHGYSAVSSHRVYEYVGIPMEPTPHHALNGAMWEAEALSRLLYDTILFDQFLRYPIPWV